MKILKLPVLFIGGCSLLLSSMAVSAAECTSELPTIDFILVEGDEQKAAVEAEIVSQLAAAGITVNTRALSKDDFNAAEKAGDFHLSFSETWGAPCKCRVGSK